MGYEGAGCGLVADLLGRELLGGEQGLGVVWDAAHGMARPLTP
jgi:hypothetical protein